MFFDPASKPLHRLWPGLLALLFSMPAWAQSGQTQNPPPSVTTLQGSILSVSATGVPMGTHLQVLAAGQTVDVYVGLKMQTGIDASAFHPGDTIQVTGELIRHTDGFLLKAWRIQDGQQVYRIRNRHGLPLNRSRRQP